MLAVKLANGFHANGSKDTYTSPGRFERRAQCQAVDDRGEHSHLVAFDAVKSFGCSAEPTKDIASANNDAYLYAHVGDFLDLTCVFGQSVLVNAVLARAHE